MAPGPAGAVLRVVQEHRNRRGDTAKPAHGAPWCTATHHCAPVLPVRFAPAGQEGSYQFHPRLRLVSDPHVPAAVEQGQPARLGDQGVAGGVAGGGDETVPLDPVNDCALIARAASLIRRTVRTLASIES